MLYVIADGELIKSNDFRIKASNRAFRFGDGLFETFRIINGVPQLLNEHFERLLSGMHLLRMDKSTFISIEELFKVVRQLIASLQTENARARLSVFREDGGLYVPQSNRVNYLLEAWPCDLNYYELNAKGVQLALFDEYTKPIHPLTGFKSLNTSIYTLAGMHARNLNADDAILLNSNKKVCEATSSNIFCVTGNKILTPPIKSGCVAGVMRKRILELCKVEDIRFSEQSLSLTDLHEAKEIWLTNAVKGLHWVSTYNNTNYGYNIAIVVTNLLNKHIQKTINL